jgi:hypothetical protein
LGQQSERCSNPHLDKAAHRKSYSFRRVPSLIPLRSIRSVTLIYKSKFIIDLEFEATKSKTLRFSFMKKILFCLIIGVGLFTVSCSKKCNCSENWDSTTTYVEDDLVLYDGKCWKALAQGRGIVPGPWQQNGNDIWKECSAVAD